MSLSRAPWVHGDEDVERRLERDHGPFEVHLLLLEVGAHGRLGAEEHQELLRDHGEHLSAPYLLSARDTEKREDIHKKPS